MGVSAPTRYRLYALSGNKCAWDGCNALLTNEEKIEDKKKAYQVGKIAHIRAQKNNGPRYDSNYPKDRIHDIDNLILLCGTHHDRIDYSPEKYTVRRLLEMKHKHESKIRAEEIPKVHFPELSVACAALASNNYIKTETDWNSTDINPKIAKNNLSNEVKNMLMYGLSRSHEVNEFLSEQSQRDTNYVNRLVKGFKDQYEIFSNDSSGDDLFYKMENWTKNVEYNYEGNLVAAQAASFIILCHLFEICEVFEK